MKENQKGLLCFILEEKGSGNCSNGGISAKCDRVILVGDGIDEIFEADEKTPAVKLVYRVISGRKYVHAEPIDKPQHVGWMAGGAFIYTSDSRFPSDYPISLHDRQETQETKEQYAELSV